MYKNNLNGKLIKEGITFDDILLIPAYSDKLPNEISLKTKLTKNIELNIPILSAAMDTVTESSLAIELAKLGGIGVIHKNLTIAEQTLEVLKVKEAKETIITKAITIKKTATIIEANNIMKTYQTSNLFVTCENEKLIGMISNEDLKYFEDLSSTIEKIINKKIITANSKITKEEAKKLMLKNKTEEIPIIDKTNTLIGLISMKDIKNLNACKDKKGKLRVAAAVGIESNTMERVDALIKAEVDALVIDSAHAHSKLVINTIKEIREKYQDIDIIAGNICTAAAAQELYQAGVNCVKVGVGPGSICTTRIIAGIGVPQVTAINEIYNWAQDKDITIIADGGIKYSGDIVKAIAAGAHSVMLGNLFAGTEESPGKEIIKNGKKYKNYIGMGSISAMKKGSHDRYFQKESKKLVPEGIEAKIPFKGKLKDIVFQLIGGLQSGMGYTGSKNIEDLRHRTKFIKISKASLNESHPHNFEIIKKSPNY